MALSHYGEWFTPENRETGLCLWVALDTFLPYACGGVDNQQQSRNFDKDAPQKIDMDWDDFHDHEKRDPLLPCNFYTYGITVTVDRDKHPLDHEVIFKWTRCSEVVDMLTIQHFRLPTVRHMQRLADFLKDGRTDVVSLLEEVDCDEYVLSAVQKAMGLPNRFQTNTDEEPQASLN